MGIPGATDMDEAYTPQAKLLQALVKASGDPDTSIPEWLSGYTPLGIELPIQTHDIFMRCPQRGGGRTTRTTLRTTSSY